MLFGLYYVPELVWNGNAVLFTLTMYYWPSRLLMMNTYCNCVMFYVGSLRLRTKSVDFCEIKSFT